ncbi:MAG: cardiolipin synthase [Bacilli bacterium]
MKNIFKTIVFALCMVAILYGLDMLFDVLKGIPYFEEFKSGVYWLYSLLITLSVILVGFVIFFENRNPSKTLAWISILSIFPLGGFILYILFGQNVRKTRKFHHKVAGVEEVIEQMKTQLKSWKQSDVRYNHENLQVLKLSERITNSPLSYQTNTKILSNGEVTFQEIVAAIEQAQHYIYIQYYIVRDDEIGRSIQQALIKKAQQGIEVKFLYDAVGCIRLSKQYINELKENGVQMVPYSPVKIPVLNDKVNFRNHRKIVVVDQWIGFMGGLNIGDEYLGRVKQYGKWRDTHMKLVGEAVQILELIFLHDWSYATGEVLTFQKEVPPPNVSTKGGAVQLIAGGPDQEWEVIKDLFFTMIASAEKSVWIASPYFIPDDDIYAALRVAALRGVDVRLLTPGWPDKKLVYHASRSYFPKLLEAGARIFQYDDGFMHSKLLIVDGKNASIGTANMDMRSFHLNFEVNAFLYDTTSVNELTEDFLQDITHSTELYEENFKKRPLRERMYESLARLFSPLL